MVTLIHVSDTHGTFPPIPEEGDVVVHVLAYCPAGVARELQRRTLTDGYI